MIHKLRLIGLITCLLAFSACASAPALDPIAIMVRSNCPWWKLSSYCPSSPWEKDFADKWRRPYQRIESLQNKYDENTSDDKKIIYRDDYINEMFAMIDEEHMHYQVSIRETKSFADFFSDLGLLGLTASGAVVGGAATKAILSAAAAALTGSKIAMNKAFFEEAAMSSILNQMDAARNTKKYAIRELMRRKVPVSDYPLSNARADMMEYLFSGSIISAIKGLAEDSSTKKRTTVESLNSQKGLNMPVTPSPPTPPIAPPTPPDKSLGNQR